MQFEELLLKVKELNCKEKRNDEDDFLEVVVIKDRLEEMESLLTLFFGAPLKPTSQAPDKEAKRLASPFGGIRFEQTMFFSLSDENFFMALFWPWGNGELITVKIFTGKKECIAKKWYHYLQPF